MSEKDELWNYPYEGVRCHRHMSRQARAAQFAPFAALEGYEEAVVEASRYVEEKPEFSEEQRQELDRIWQDLCRRGLEYSRLRITYFQEDLRKHGGTWRTAIVQCKNLDRIKRCLVTQDGQKIPLGCIC